MGGTKTAARQAAPNSGTFRVARGEEEERRRRQSKVCGLGSNERGAGASSACFGGIVFEVFACQEMGRRPEAFGVQISKTIPRGHPELSLDPQCMHTAPSRHCLPKNVAPYRSRTPGRVYIIVHTAHLSQCSLTEIDPTRLQCTDKERIASQKLSTRHDHSSAKLYTERLHCLFTLHSTRRRSSNCISESLQSLPSKPAGAAGL